MQRKMLSKLYIVATFAMFGLFLQPTVFANDSQQVNIVEVNENTKQSQIYLIQLKSNQDSMTFISRGGMIRISFKNKRFPTFFY